MKELYEQIKTRLDNFEDESFILPYDEEIGGYRFGDDEYDYFESSDMVIFRGNGWYGDEEVIVKKIYTDDDGDDVMFDLNYIKYNYKGNVCEDELMTEVWTRLLDGRCSSNGEQGEELEKEVLENIIKVMDYFKDHLEEYDDIISKIDDEEDENDWDDDDD